MKIFFVLIISLARLQAQVTVSTGDYDLNRDGANINETILTQAKVGAINQFHLLWSYSVNGTVYAQPLIIPGVSGIGGKTICLIVTGNNYIYAEDANSGANIWTQYMGAAFNSGDSDLYGTAGIIGTPVVDLSTNILYLIAQNSMGGAFIYSLSLTTGATLFSNNIAAIVNGQTFDSPMQMQRPALTLIGTNVYVAFGSYGDSGTWAGWIMGYDKSTLARTSAFVTNPSGTNGAAIWQGGGGLSYDGTYLYSVSGNGGNCTTDYGEEALQLSTALAVNQNYGLGFSTCSTYNTDDTDLGSSRFLLLGSSGYGILGGKDGILRVIQTSSMTLAQSVSITGVPRILDGIAYSPASNLFFVAPGTGAGSSVIQEYSWNGTAISSSPIESSANAYRWNGLSISSNGSEAGTEILWANTTTGSATSAGVLRAFRTDTMVEIWDSGMDSGDALGQFCKFAKPTVANGLVYQGNSAGKVNVYGSIASSSTATIWPIQ